MMRNSFRSYYSVLKWNFATKLVNIMLLLLQILRSSIEHCLLLFLVHQASVNVLYALYCQTMVLFQDPFGANKDSVAI